MKTDVLVCTALEEELTSLLNSFPIQKEIHSQKAPLIYHFGHITSDLQDQPEISFVITCLYSMGNTDAGIIASLAIEELSPQYIIMFGLAAGIRGRIALGDVIIASEIQYYELGKQCTGDIEIRPQSANVDPYLKNCMLNFSTTAKSSWDFQVRTGPFAVGEKVISDSDVVSRLLVNHPKLIGIEMESYGVGRAAHTIFQRPRFIAVRGVCDFADESKNDDYRAIALENANTFLRAYFQKGFIIRSEPHAENSPKYFIAIHHLSLNPRSKKQGIDLSCVTEVIDQTAHILDINQTKWFHDGVVSDPEEAFRVQQLVEKTIGSLLSENPHSRLGYFGLAHIPFIFHIGCVVNREEVEVFATDRQTSEWVALDEGASNWPALRVSGLPKVADDGITDVVVQMSISYPILQSQIDELTLNIFAHFISIEVEIPAPDLVTSKDQLGQYASVFHRTLVEINRMYPHMKRLHLFYAGPPILAFRCGQQISRTIDPEILVYNYSRWDSPRYGWALSLSSGKIIDRRKNKES